MTRAFLIGGFVGLVALAGRFGRGELRLAWDFAPDLLDRGFARGRGHDAGRRGGGKELRSA